MSAEALLGRLRIDVEAHFGKLHSGMQRAESRIDKFSKRLIQLQGIAVGVAGAAGFGQLIGSMVTATNKVLGWEAALLTATGSMVAARAEIEFMKRTADDIGISLSGAADEYVKLAVAAKDTALEGAGVREVFIGVAETARIFNLSADDSAGAFRALTQAMNKGVLSMEEWRQQFAERIPGAMKLGAQAMDLTVQEFAKMISLGEVLTTEFLPKYIRLQREANKAGIELAKSLPAAEIERMSNAFFNLGAAIGKSGFMGLLGDLASVIAGITNLITRNIDGIISWTGVILKVSAGVAAAHVAGLAWQKVIYGLGVVAEVLITRSVSLTAATVAQTVAMRAAAVAGTALSKVYAFIGGPVGVAVLAATGVWLWVDSLKAQKKAAEEAQKATDDLAKAASDGHRGSIVSASLAQQEAKADLEAAQAILERKKAHLQWLNSAGSAPGIAKAEAEIERLKGIIDKMNSSMAAGIKMINDIIAGTAAAEDAKNLQKALDELADKFVKDFMVDVEKAAKAAKAFQDQLNDLADDMINDIYRAAEQTRKEWEEMTEALWQSGQAARSAAHNFGEMHKEIDKTGNVVRRFGEENDDLDESLVSLQESMDDAADAFIKGFFADVADDIKKAEEAAKSFQDALDELADEVINDIYRAAEQTRKEWDKMAKSLYASGQAARSAAAGNGELHKEIDANGDVIRRFGEENDDAASAALRHAESMRKLKQEAAATTDVLGPLGQLLGAIGITGSFGGISAAIGGVNSLPNLLSAFLNPEALIPILAGGGGAMFGGNPGAIAGGVGGAMGGSALMMAMLLGGGPPTAAVAAMMPWLVGGAGVLGGIAGGFGGNAIGKLFGLGKDEKRPRIVQANLESGAFPGEGGRFGQRSFLADSPLGRVFVGGREGQSLTQEMMDVAKGLVAIDEAITEHLTPEQIQPAIDALVAIGENTDAANFDPAVTAMQRVTAIAEAVGGEFGALFDQMKPTEESLQNFITSLDTLIGLSETGKTLAANFDMADDGFNALIIMLKGFEEFAASGSFQDVVDAITRLNESPWDTFSRVTQDLIDAQAAFDGTAASTRELNTALVGFGQAELAVMRQLDAARGSVSASIASATQRVSFLGMTPEDIWNQSRTGANDILGQLQRGEIADPGAVQAATNLALQNFNTGFNALSPEQQLAQREDALEFLAAIDEAAAESFDDIENTIERIHENAAETMKDAMKDSAKLITDATAAQAIAIEAAARRLDAPPDVTVVIDSGGEVNR